MKRCLSFTFFAASQVFAVAFVPPATAQIPATEDSAARSYQSDGKTDQPFTVEIVAARRTVNNVLLLRVALTNRGNAPLAPHQDFSGNGNPTDDNRISAVFAVDPNGRKKYGVIRDGGNVPLCGEVVPPIPPGERRVLDAQLLAPPGTTSAVDVYFPRATPILGVPLGLPAAGESLTGAGAAVAVPAGAGGVQGIAPLAPPPAIDQPTSNNQPDVYTNQLNPAAPGKDVGSINSGNTETPFTVEITALKANAGGHAELRLALTNNGSGPLDPADQFTDGSGDPAGKRTISGVYLVDPVSKQRFSVLRPNGTAATGIRIDPVLNPGEKRSFTAEFPPIPASIKSVYLYFPHATPVADVPVTP